MRHIDNAVCRKCAGRQQEKNEQKGYGRRFHRRKNNPSDQSSNGIDPRFQKLTASANAK
jgi:hypothetical protein